MSGYDQSTGWCHFTPTKLSRYYRRIEGEPDAIEERLGKAGIPYYLDKIGGVHARCTDGKLWTLLSGRPETWSAEEKNSLTTEYLVVSDIAVNLEPKTSGAGVNNLLHKLGYQNKIDGSWQATEKGNVFSKSMIGMIDEKTYLIWDFAMIGILQAERSNKQK